MTAHYKSTAAANKKRKGMTWNFEKGRLNAIAAAHLNGGKSRPAPPVTLPKLKFMEDVQNVD